MLLIRLSFLFLLACWACPALAQEDTTPIQTGEADLFREEVLGVAGVQAVRAAIAAREAMNARADQSTARTEALVSQVGLSHQATIDQLTSAAYGAIYQDGGADGPNVATLYQEGVDLVSVIVQSGSGHAAAVSQVGVGHTASVTQVGTGHTATITQRN